MREYSEGKLSGLFYIEFSAADAWFEEDEQIFVHPKDPYKVRLTPMVYLPMSYVSQRVDVLQTSRHIRVELNGVEVANTKRARLLFETSLRVRTYIPKTDCRLDLFLPSQLTTECPYKVRPLPICISDSV